MKEHTLKRALIMAGGTGGHVFPGLAVANFLMEQGIEVNWMGTKAGLEARLVPQANIPIHYIEVSGLRGKGLKAYATAPFKLMLALSQAMRIIHQVQPDVIIGMGGFVSGPGGLASFLSRRPLVIHEQNAKAGLTNQLLARIAKRILTGFPHTFPGKMRAITVGNPIRESIAALNPTQRSIHHPLHLLVLGGSLGAQKINEILPQALSQMEPAMRPQVLHQTGTKHLAETQKIYASLGLSADVQPFLEDMASAYQWADIVLCRAGALTVAELCAAGLGAILVPYPFAVDDHQTANAMWMVKHQAALCVPQADLTVEKVVTLIKDFTKTPEKLTQMGQAAYAIRQIAVTERIFAILTEI